MKIFLSIIVALALAVPASAQLSFTSSDFLARSQSNQSTTDYQDTSSNTADLKALMNQSGANQTWVFGNGSGWINSGTPSSNTTIFAYPGSAADADSFAGATHVFESPSTGPTNPTSYEFLKINSNGAWLLGVSQDSAGVKSVLLTYSPPLQLYAFPLTYQTSWHSTSNFNTSLYSGLPSGTQITESSDGLVDGYGTLSVPGHSESTLRIRTKTTTAASFLTLVIFSSTSTSFDWITKSGYGASISTDSTAPSDPMSISGGDYSVPGADRVAQLPLVSDPLTLHLSQNPASNTETSLSYVLQQDGPAQVMLMDPLGKTVKMLVDGRGHAGTNSIPIDPATLASGSYLLHVSADGKDATIKLVIAK